MKLRALMPRRMDAPNPGFQRYISLHPYPYLHVPLKIRKNYVYPEEFSSLRKKITFSVSVHPFKQDPVLFFPFQFG